MEQYLQVFYCLQEPLSPSQKNTLQLYLPIFVAEGSSSVNEVHLIRNNDGYYFVTANGFQNVYVFAPGEGELKLENTIEFVENALGEPAFNKREGYIELVDLSNNESYRLDHEGILEEETE